VQCNATQFSGAGARIGWCAAASATHPHGMSMFRLMGATGAAHLAGQAVLAALSLLA
jgi:hypothetical protein